MYVQTLRNPPAAKFEYMACIIQYSMFISKIPSHVYYFPVLPFQPKACGQAGRVGIKYYIYQLKTCM